jgi:hypothetical protein
MAGWMRSLAERRLRREWNEYQHPPEVRLSPRSQVFRSLVQVNFYPRGNEPRRILSR